MWGAETVGTSAPTTNWKILDYVRDIDLVVWADDQENRTGISSGHDVSRRNLWWMRISKKLGKENIIISPHYNFSAAGYQIKKWFPVLPCQDGALHLAMQYIWLTEGTYDKAYVAKYAVGFDKYADYVLGKEDGVPKTPEWAAPRCGIKEWHIKALAKKIATKRTTFSGTFGTMMRGPYSTEVIRQFIASMAMQGLAKPGRTMGAPVSGLPSTRQYSIAFDRGRNPDLAARGLEENEIAKDDMRPHQFIPKTLLSYAILNPPITWYGTCSPKWVASDQFRKFTYPIEAAKGGTRIRMIWTDTPCRSACWQGGSHTWRAYQDPSIEFVLTEHPWMEDDTLLSDIILPTTTGFEEYDISAATAAEGYQAVFIQEPSIDPVGEAKTDYDVSLEVAKKLEKLGGRYAGIVKKYTWGNEIEDWFKVGYKVQELQQKTGMTYDQFKAKKLWVSPGLAYTEKDLSRQPGVTNFYDDPVKNPLQTPTGLIEFESTALKANLPDDRERPPVPHWIAGGPGWTWEETPETARGKKYPLLVEGCCPRWRHHNQRDDVTWFREIPTFKVKGPDGYLYEPVWINPIDAAARGIVQGDVVSVFNERGTILCGAYVTNRVVPGGLVIHHGSRIDPIATPTKPGEMIDRGGENNLICGDNTISQNCGGQVGSGWLCQVEKTDLAALRAKYPEAFAREFDASGVTFDAWVEGGT
jgi:trimethylamine-N-oxide reductase (cytochrome c)